LPFADCLANYGKMDTVFWTGAHRILWGNLFFFRECFWASSRKFITISVFQGQQAVLQAPAQEPHAFGACKERSSTHEQKRVNTRFKPLQYSFTFFYKWAIEIVPYLAVNIPGFGIRIRMNLSSWIWILIQNADPYSGVQIALEFWRKMSFLRFFLVKRKFLKKPQGKKKIIILKSSPKNYY
jgi:hypothetical protein